MRKISREEMREFKKTDNGLKKYKWMIAGAFIDFFATLGLTFLINYSYLIKNDVYFYALLFVLLVIVVLGGELIGVYFGAAEQYVYNKNQKKVLDINE